MAYDPTSDRYYMPDQNHPSAMYSKASDAAITSMRDYFQQLYVEDNLYNQTLDALVTGVWQLQKVQEFISVAIQLGYTEEHAKRRTRYYISEFLRGYIDRSAL